MGSNKLASRHLRFIHIRHCGADAKGVVGIPRWMGYRNSRGDSVGPPVIELGGRRRPGKPGDCFLVKGPNRPETPLWFVSARRLQGNPSHKGRLSSLRLGGLTLSHHGSADDQA